jgi:hypothetical protein
MSNSQNINRRRSWLNLPELNIAIFAFLLIFVWEVQQMPFFQLSDLSCNQRIINSLRYGFNADYSMDNFTFGNCLVC